MKVKRSRRLGWLVIICLMVAMAAVAVGCSQKKQPGKDQVAGEEQSKVTQAEGQQNKAGAKNQLEPDKSLQKVIISYPSPGLAFLPAQIAIDKGFFAEEGLSVDLGIVALQQTPAALSSGDIDYTLAFSSIVGAVLKGLPLKVIGAITVGPQHMLISRPELKTVKDLQGKALGVSSVGGTDQIIAEAITEALGGDAKAFKVLAAGNEAARAEALKNKVIDATAVSPPWPVILKNQGFNVLGGPADLKAGPPAGAICAASDKIQKDPGQVKKVLKALVRGLQFTTDPKNKDYVVKEMQDWLKLEHGIAEESYKLVLPTYSRDGKGPDAGYREILKITAAQGGGDPNTPVSKLVDWTLLEHVQKDLGLSK